MHLVSPFPARRIPTIFLCSYCPSYDGAISALTACVPPPRPENGPHVTCDPHKPVAPLGSGNILPREKFSVFPIVRPFRFHSFFLFEHVFPAFFSFPRFLFHARHRWVPLPFQGGLTGSVTHLFPPPLWMGGAGPDGMFFPISISAPAVTGWANFPSPTVGLFFPIDCLSFLLQRYAATAFSPFCPRSKSFFL